jgi:hypothetical protein
MAEPSIKGALFKGVVDDLVRLQEQGRVSEEQLDAQLAPEDVALLEEQVNVAAWYPLDTYVRLMGLLSEIEGAGKDAYFVERGRASARRMMAAGLYQQLAFLSRFEETVLQDASDPSATIADYTRNLKMVTTLASTVYNVGKWVVEPDPEHAGRVRIAVREAGAYSESMRLVIEGFVNECARAAREDLAHLHTSERPSPDLILIRMTIDIVDVFQR